MNVWIVLGTARAKLNCESLTQQSVKRVEMKSTSFKTILFSYIFFIPSCSTNPSMNDRERSRNRRTQDSCLTFFYITSRACSIIVFIYSRFNHFSLF